jgi:hypothetical protein
VYRSIRSAHDLRRRRTPGVDLGSAEPEIEIALPNPFDERQPFVPSEIEYRSSRILRIPNPYEPADRGDLNAGSRVTAVAS